MSRSATRTGPGIARSPSAQRLMVRASTSSAAAAATCDRPSDASAARNSSADNDAILAKGQAGSGQDRTQGVQRLVNGEGVGQAAVSAKQGQALRAISAGSDETNGVGGQGWDGGGLAHNSCVGPMALYVNNQIAAAESDRGHGGEGGVNALPGRPAHPMPRTSAHPSRPAAGRTVSVRVSDRGVSSRAANTAANYPAGQIRAGSSPAGASSYVSEFYRRIALSRAHPDAMRLSAYEDRMLGNGLAAGLSFAAIARDICERRRDISEKARKRAAARWGK
jgi:hypothetical protein